MEKHTIGGLRQILVSESDFYKIQDYFLTLTETNYQAIHGQLGKNKILKEVIQAILGGVTGTPKPVLVNFSMIEVRQRNFWHGSGFINGKIFTFIYFADIDKGMISLATGGSETLFIRVSTKSTPKKPTLPNMN
jgi:hypothetical protein